MKIKTTELPKTLDAIRQEVIKKEGKKRADAYQQQYMNASQTLLFVPIAVWLIVYEFMSHTSSTKMAIWMGIFMIIGMIASSYVMSGKAEKVFHKRYAHTNYGLSEREIADKMVAYITDMIKKMQEDLDDLEHQKLHISTNLEDAADAYLPIFNTYTTLKVQLQITAKGDIGKGNYQNGTLFSL